MKLNNKQKLEIILNKKLYVKGLGSAVIDVINQITGLHIKADSYKRYPFFYITDNDGLIEFHSGCDMEHFTPCALDEISIDKILELQEPRFQPYERVLVRNHDTQTWYADLFSHMDDISMQFECIGGKWNQCIPYEGNESKLGSVLK